MLLFYLFILCLIIIDHWKVIFLTGLVMYRILISQQALRKPSTCIIYAGERSPISVIDNVDAIARQPAFSNISRAGQHPVLPGQLLATAQTTRLLVSKTKLAPAVAGRLKDKGSTSSGGSIQRQSQHQQWPADSKTKLAPAGPFEVKATTSSSGSIRRLS